MAFLACFLWPTNSTFELHGTMQPSVAHVIHVLSVQLAIGVMCQVGTLMGGTDKFYVRVMGVGGHGGTPHLVKDTVVAASAVVMNLQPLISRETDPAHGGVVGVTLINSGKHVLWASHLRSWHAGSHMHQRLKAAETLHSLTYIASLPSFVHCVCRLASITMMALYGCVMTRPAL